MGIWKSRRDGARVQMGAGGGVRRHAWMRREGGAKMRVCGGGGKDPEGGDGELGCEREREYFYTYKNIFSYTKKCFCMGKNGGGPAGTQKCKKTRFFKNPGT